tara:strand:- start:442 stop:636 length:195 start_codon:yes stop_codon:yes gene_type:complete
MVAWDGDSQDPLIRPMTQSVVDRIKGCGIYRSTGVEQVASKQHFGDLVLMRVGIYLIQNVNTVL